MGVSHLYNTLRPLAVWELLENDNVVIDGPALAYHALHVCRANGISQPSYGLLSRVTLSWLDSLCLHNVVIRKIYFDGHLPSTKLDVRIGRLIRTTARLRNLYVSHRQGCPTSYLAGDDTGANIDTSKTGCTESLPPLDPCFLVPAVLDCLRASSQYRQKTELVPGEADHFCAADVSKYGGILVTSDSDLLVHDIGKGRVAFLKDLHLDSQHVFRFLSFAPGQIFDKLGLAYPDEAVHFAYERKLAPQATLSQLIDRCVRMPPRSADYLEFQKSYARSDAFLRIQRIGADIPNLRDLDPRISEFLLDCYARRSGLSDEVAVRMFLPPLMECPDLRSAWDRSTPVRQLAYCIVDSTVLSRLGGLQIQEFRRVENGSSTGRQIRPLSPNPARELMKLIMQCAERFQAHVEYDGGKFWIMLAMALDDAQSEKDGRASIMETIEVFFACQSTFAAEHTPWVIIHIWAQLQATWYSFRILQHTMRTVFSPEFDEGFPEAKTLCTLLSKLMTMELYPNVSELSRSIQELRQSGAIRELERYLHQEFRSCHPARDIVNFETCPGDNAEKFMLSKGEDVTNRDENNPFSVLDLES